MKKKINILVSLLILIFTFPVFAQEETNEETQKIGIIGEPFHLAKNINELMDQVNISLQMGPSLYINKQSVLVSAPSPVLFPVSIGAIWPAKSFLSIQPSVSFFIMNYLWYDGKALPAEIENRTATTYNFFLNIPATLSLFTNICKIQFSAGAGFMFRIINLSLDVQPTDSGFSGSAQSDVGLITQYLWGNARFLYITTEISILFNVYRSLRTGPIFGAYVPLGSLINKEGMAAAMVYTGIKIIL